MASGKYNVQQDDDVPLIPYSEEDTQSLYNFGPREATDVVCGRIFMGVMSVFVLWIAAGAAILKDYPTIFVINATGTGCPDPYDPHALGDPDTLLGSEEHDRLVATVVVPLVGAVIGAFAMGALLLTGFRYIPTFMVYSVVFVKIAAPAVVGVYLMTQKSDLVVEDDDDIYNDDTTASEEGNAFMIPAYMCFAASAIIALIFFCFRTALKLTVELFRESSVGMSENFWLIPVNAGIVLVTLVFYLAMLVGFVWYVIHGKKESIDNCEFELTMSSKILIPFGSVALGWFLFWSLETRTYIVSDTVGAWYWHGKNGASISRACGHAFKTHFGTIAFAGLVVWIVESLKKQARKKTRNILVCIIKMVILCILSYIEYLCKMAVIVSSITGKAFVDSGHQVVSLFTESFGNMNLSTGVWWIPKMILNAFVMLMSLLWAIATGFVVYGTIIEKKNGVECGNYIETIDSDDCENTALIYAIILGCFCFLICLYLLAFFANIMLGVVDTVFVCFLMDKSRGVVTKPAIHGVLEQVLLKRGVSMKIRGGAPASPQGGVVVHHNNIPPQQQHYPVQHQPQHHQQQFAQQQQPQYGQQQQLQQPGGYVQQPAYGQQPQYGQQQQQPPQYNAQPTPQFCSACGAALSPSMKFCQSCGVAAQ